MSRKRHHDGSDPNVRRPLAPQSRISRFNLNQERFPLRFPGEIRNKIYQILFDDFMEDYRPYIIMREGIDPGCTSGSPCRPIVNSEHPLVLTAPYGDGVIPYDQFGFWIDAAEQTILHQRYRDMKRDLIAVGQISQQFMHEYRSFQRARLDPFVHLDELENFINIFYPSKDLAVANNYRGRLITITLPKHTTDTYDILPLLRFFARAPHLHCNIWALLTVSRPGMWHGEEVRDALFGATNSLRSYLATPAPESLSIVNIEFRTHGVVRRYRGNAFNHHDKYHSAIFKVTFAPTDRQDWMDGNFIYFQNNASRTGTRMNKDRARRQHILQFLKDVGMDFDSIRESWEMSFGVLGQS
ncbi:uncharacterized protein K460DRAFT_354081 [Cucurbitaria berberidis CBS 394.84]|uniref:Uncharacterized protein n=1 Tax=Cucurbitaria berberidis CBS 394.84 TaxID=1168544 RepID=A0A9P4GQ03_9PLEO|nr:uncharacterized protein K460DRAFT_354081 [Cucurbitaria berberidis CBS 394.84]KAF1849207.1 hypothetical protein K460DRAFT_354081 [Cucurbitaria berberidis CBS 394.84]